jgi:hypothetical protein
MMPPRPRLTPEEQRTIRNWSVAMGAIYSMVLLLLLMSVIVNSGTAHSVADTAAAEMRQDAAGAISSHAPRPLTEASTQR